MITYQEIYDLLRKEKYSDSLVKLPSNLFNEVGLYLKEKKTLVEKKDNLFSETIKSTRKQLDNAISIIKELISIREKKVLNLAFMAAMTGINKKDTTNLLKHEEDLFETVTKKLEQNQEKIKETFEGRDAEQDNLNRLVRFKKDVLSVLDPSNNKIGPFHEDDVANLPKEIVQILIDDNKVEPIE